MFRAWRSVISTIPAVRVQTPLGADFNKNIMFHPSELWDFVSMLIPSHASFDSRVNEYLVGQRWQCVR